MREAIVPYFTNYTVTEFGDVYRNDVTPRRLLKVKPGGKNTNYTLGLSQNGVVRFLTIGTILHLSFIGEIPKGFMVTLRDKTRPHLDSITLERGHRGHKGIIPLEESKPIQKLSEKIDAEASIYAIIEHEQERGRDVTLNVARMFKVSEDYVREAHRRVRDEIENGFLYRPTNAGLLSVQQPAL